jgi:hypothetical protein
LSASTRERLPFEHNPEHLWISPETGTSSILRNRQFYDWLHAQTGA